MYAIGSDHGGYELKEKVKKYLKDKGYEFFDFGTHDKQSCDYPKFALDVAESVACGKYKAGILICGTGIGISIAANKVPGIRAALCDNQFEAKYTRLHNDANILCMGGRVLGEGVACEIADTFLTTEFEGGRHKRRIDMITEIEKKYSK